MQKVNLVVKHPYLAVGAENDEVYELAGRRVDCVQNRVCDGLQRRRLAVPLLLWSRNVELGLVKPVVNVHPAQLVIALRKRDGARIRVEGQK